MANANIQSTSSSSSSSSSSSRRHQWKYDVFLSFRGGDTRKNFTDHLYSALDQKGIITFKDDKRLERGKDIGPELLKAIEQSRFSIVIFSKEYSSSSWCLDELVKIVECMKSRGQVVFPVFYGVDPFDVESQRGNFGAFFAKHEEEQEAEKVKNWRKAVTTVANLSGFDLHESHEAEAVQKIVGEIFKRLSHTVFRSSTKNLVGIASRLEKVKSCLSVESKGVCIIGIHGMGGIGKTTLARVIYESISSEFDASTFLANVREVYKNSGLVILQKQLLCETLMEEDIKIWDVYRGLDMLSKRLCSKKVLVILDDVDESCELEKLVGDRDWFGSGSKIIITTRDAHLLQLYGVDEIYKMEELKFEEAFQLFCLKAFKTTHPVEDFVEMSKKVVDYANGLPLALEVFGSFLYGRSIEEWESALAELEKDSGKKILDRLEISFHGLGESEKNG